MTSFVLLTLSGALSLGQEGPAGEASLSVHRAFLEAHRSFDVARPYVAAGTGYAIAPLLPRQVRGGLTREVFGYLPYWFRDRWRLLDYSLVSTIAYFSGEASSDGVIFNTHGWPASPGDPNASADVVGMINRAHQNGVRVVLCITSFDGNAIHSIVSTEAYRTALIQQALDLVTAGAADGININFEAILSADRDALTGFMRALADSFHARMPQSQVSCAPTDFDTRAGDWDLAAIDPYVDLFFFQGYGYGYGGSSVAMPVGLLPNTTFWGSLNITTFINFVLARIPPTKAVLGVPHYGRSWPTVGPDAKAATAGSGTAFYYPDALGYTQAYGRLWDGLALNPWFRYQSAGQWYQGWYDDPESMSHKYRFVLDRSLMGVGMWALGMDAGNHDIWDVLADYFLDSTATRPPGPPVLGIVKDSSSAAEGRVVVTWNAEKEDVLGGFRLLMTTDPFGGAYEVVLDEHTLDSLARSAVVEQLPLGTALYFRVVAVDTSGTSSSDSSDTYGVRTGPGPRYLVVDGYDRITGSYNASSHVFNAYYTVPLASIGRMADAADNDPVIAGRVHLDDYDAVIWFLGDESVADRTFDGTEQQLVAAYLEGGGKLFVTGSEVGYDLGRSASPNASTAWYVGNLKATYLGDDAATVSFSGAAGSILEGIGGLFGQTYPEDYPDYLGTAGGSSAALLYAGGRIAGIQYQGTFGAGSVPGRLVYVAFPYETIGSPDTRTTIMARIDAFFQATNSTGSGRQAVPRELVLEQNFPNPFNPTTTIRFELPEATHVVVEVVDVLGRRVARLLDEHCEIGTHAVVFDARNSSGLPLATGMYVCILKTPTRSLEKPMMLVR